MEKLEYWALNKDIIEKINELVDASNRQDEAIRYVTYLTQFPEEWKVKVDKVNAILNGPPSEAGEK